ncbi:cupin domain-containing protein [Bradyrhizobium sp. JYMT SZCCT0428]|uniref:cupin domain-containing protein n=1 Tax=Bradyrhizobium sp. JYMT SZCCT0428 TaxID=2807673 RepID=UPI001BA43F49|nr:cupin domain-containing protein [Bradyrhizobium sp. JYMT SZCCT0428]MBR1155960.1 hypothetical protein [Bradyrhizobium sp. JYMT SZCCT0428]
MRKTALLSAIALFLVATTAWLSAQESFVRAPLQKSEYPAGYETHIMLVTSAPGALLPRHSHPGVEMSYIVEGELTVTDRRQGRPCREGGVILLGSSGRGPQRKEHRLDPDQGARDFCYRERQAGRIASTLIVAADREMEDCTGVDGEIVGRWSSFQNTHPTPLAEQTT